jgi:hypothetical protein
VNQARPRQAAKLPQLCDCGDRQQELEPFTFCYGKRTMGNVQLFASDTHFSYGIVSSGLDGVCAIREPTSTLPNR